jgi:bleomycin hydrolase
MRIPTIFLSFLVLLSCVAFAQEHKDKASFIPYSNEYYDQIRKADEVFKSPPATPTHKTFKMDVSGVDAPKSLAEFKIVQAGKPVSQGETGTCWCFSTTSFYESEIARISKKEIHLSEIYIVYWQYVEKAKEFVNTRGKSIFDDGSETNAVAKMMKLYGVVPLESYTGILPGQPYHDHTKMVDEMKAYLKSVKEANAWNTDQVMATIKAIMNHYLGAPPAMVSVDGKKLTPLEYLRDVTKLNPDDYVDFMSLMEKPYYTKAEYAVPDNWWHSTDFNNVPLDDFMTLIKTAVKNGYSIAIGGDDSESGMDYKTGIAVIPSYDIPSNYIDENARQVRFLNGATTDDHAMHLVGYEEKTNGTWFLIKDSGSGGHNNQNAPGYWFMHEDFVKLKVMTITLHKDAAKELLAKMKK